MKVFSKKRIAVLCVICLFACMVSGFTTPAAGTNADALAAPVTVTSTVVQQHAESTVPVYLNGIKAADGTALGDTVYMPIAAFYDVAGIQADIVRD